MPTALRIIVAVACVLFGEMDGGALIQQHGVRSPRWCKAIDYAEFQQAVNVTVSRECCSDFSSAVAFIFHFYKISFFYGTVVEMLQPFPKHQNNM